MQKNVSVAKVMLVTLICFVAALTFTSCEKDEIFENSSTITPTPTRTDVFWLFARDTMFAIVGGDTIPAQQVTSTPKIRAERIYKEEGTNGIAPTANLEASFVNNIATSFPYNYGINNEVYVNQYVTLTVGGVTYENVPAAETLQVRGWHHVDNVSSAPFHEQSHTTYTLLNSLGEVVIINNDSISCQQLFAVREVLPTVVHDTVWQERVIHDTIHMVDTVWQERVIHDTVINGLWVDSVVTRRRCVVNHSHLSTRTTDTYTATTATTGSLETRCTNRTDSVFTERLYIWYSDATVDSTRTRNWSSSHNWYKIWTRSVAIYGTNPGSGTATVSGNVADFGGGFRVVLGNPVVTTSPAGYNPNSTNCTHNVIYMVASATGVTEKGAVAHGATADTTQGFIPCNGTTPTVTRIDTLWGACGTATAWYQAAPAEQVKATVGKAYSLVRVWSDSHSDTVNGGTATTTYVWNVIRTGQPTSAMASTLPVNGNPASFGGGSFTEALSQVGSQRFCPLNWNSATLTSSTTTTGTTTWSGSYGTTTVTVSVPETFQVAPPITGKRLIAGWVTYAYQSNTSAPEEWGVLYTEDLATGQRYFEYIPWHTGTVLYSEVTNTSSISASDTNAIRTQINAGRYGARVYNHNSTSHQWLPGMTHSTQNGSSSSTSWTVTYWFVGGTEANHVDLIVGTTDVNSGNSRRGVWNGSMLTADGGTLYVSNL